MNSRTKNLLSSLLLLSAVSLSTTSCANDNDAAVSTQKPVTESSTASITTSNVSPMDNAMTDVTEHGEEAHKNHCYKCHTDDIYTRDNRFVKSIDALSQQVVRCKDGSNVPWFDEDSDAVVQFLNKKYYKF